MSDIHFGPPASIQDFHPRIVGGENVRPPFKYGSFMVSLHLNGKHACGGALYKQDTVITAAHCVLQQNSNWTARIHRHDISKMDIEEDGKVYNILDRIKHEKYNPNIYANDIALWKLAGAPSSERTNLELDTGTYSNQYDIVYKAIGWGKNSEKNNKNRTTILQEVSLPKYDFNKCNETYSKSKYPLNSELQLCAGYDEGGKDSCQGDSGGPLITKNRESGNFVLVGATSFGIGCAREKLPGVYTKISAYIKWIEDTCNKLGN